MTGPTAVNARHTRASGMRNLARTLSAKSKAGESLRLILARLKRHLNRKRAAKAVVSRPQGTPPRRILVVMNGGIGNAVEASPLVQAIQMHWPDARIDVLTPHANLFDGWNLVSEFVRLLDPPPRRGWDHTFVTWSATLPEGEGIRATLGEVHTVPLLGAWFLKPEREYNLDMIRRLGFRGPCPPLYVSVSAPLSWSAQDGLWLAIVPGGQSGLKWQNKRWPHFDALLKMLLECSDSVHVCILGGPDDPAMEFPREEGRVFDMRGQWSLSEVAWILKQMHVVVGNDCGPMHIADAVHAPAVVLFGPTCEVKNGPFHGGRVLRTSIECRPCQYVKTQFTCSDPRCLSDLEPARVLQAITELLPHDAKSRDLRGGAAGTHAHAAPGSTRASG